MKQRIVRWLAVLMAALVVGVGMAIGGGQPQVAHGEGSTPTPTPLSIDGQPGGYGGGHF